MNIELGSIGSAMGNITGSIGRVPSLASLGSVLEAPTSAVSLDGPVASLEGFIPMGMTDLVTPPKLGGTLKPVLGITPAGEINFNVPALKSIEAVEPTDWPEITESIKNETVVEPRIIGEASYWFTDVEPRVVRPAEVIMPQIEPMVTPLIAPAPESAAIPAWMPAIGTQAKTEVRNSTQPAQAVAAQVEEIVEEKVQQEPEEVLEEEEITERKLYLEDHEASAVRKHEIRQAIIKARAEANRLGLDKIAGWLVAKFLPAEYDGNRSQIVKKSGPDGSYQETVEAITGAGEFESGETAVKKFDWIVAEKKPVKFGKNGNPVGNADVARVFKYRLIKPIQAHEEVVKRVTKKKVLVSQAPAPSAITEKKAIKVEPNLEEVSPALAEVFKKAA